MVKILEELVILVPTPTSVVEARWTGALPTTLISLTQKDTGQVVEVPLVDLEDAIAVIRRELGASAP